MLLKTASDAARGAPRPFICRIFNSPWDQFVLEWAPKIYNFVG